MISVTAIHNFSSIGKSIREMKRVGTDKFVLSVLKKSKKSAFIQSQIKKNFKIESVLEEGKDSIFRVKKT